jgi:hypothetical protein
LDIRALSPLLAWSAVIVDGRLRSWQLLLDALYRIDELARHDDDALRIDPFGDRIAIAGDVSADSRVAASRSSLSRR